MKKIYQFLGYIGLAFAFTACTDAVEKIDLDKITDDVIWGEPQFIIRNFDNVMYSAIPGSERGLLAHADESYGSAAVVYDNFNANTADNGIAWENVDRWSYEALRKINRFLDHAGHDGFVSPQPMTSALPQAEKEDMVAQMLVIRAFLYFDMVRTYGGVPLLLHEMPQAANFEDMQMARSKTSECIAQIVKDLDDAIAIPSFPMKRGDDGRINKGLAYALKGRVLLYYASPQFVAPPAGSQHGGKPAGTKSAEQRWNEAYAACREAYDRLTAAGFGLYAPDGGDRKTVMENYYKMLVTEEMNKEMVWVRRYYPNIRNNGVEQDLRPGSSSGGTYFPCWEMTAAFGNADGSKFTALQVDYSKDAGGGEGTYTQGSMTPHLVGRADGPDGSYVNEGVFWLNREPRFYAFIGYNGCEYPLTRDRQGVFGGYPYVQDNKLQHEWIFCREVNGGFLPFTQGYNQTGGRGQGLCLRKFISANNDYMQNGVNTSNQGGVDWPLFRFAEVVLNLAEAAAKTGKTQEAYDMLGSLRKRAGIPAANNYGLGPNTGDALILDILNERRLELFLEGHRMYDARRWRLYSDGLAGFKINGLQRHTLQTWLRNPADAGNESTMAAVLKPIIDAGGIDNPPQMSGGVDIDPGRTAYFKVFYHTFMLYDRQTIRYNPERQDFFRIPYIAHIQKNPKIEQTIGWTDDRGTGTFNPWE